jgi:diguanylate cyclase (GGDEF)-like protein
MASTPMQGLMFGYSALAPIIATFGFVLMYSEHSRAELEKLAATDPLTGALNRRMLEQLLTAQLADIRRHPRPLSVLMLDVDKFKTINDSFGHDVGDTVLKAVVATSRLQLRPGDLIGRLGGEEFLIVLDNTGEAEAVQIAERLRATIANLNLVDADRRVPLSISIGVASRKSERSDFGELVRRADRAMYAAKSGGGIGWLRGRLRRFRGRWCIEGKHRDPIVG